MGVSAQRLGPGATGMAAVPRGCCRKVEARGCVPHPQHGETEAQAREVPHMVVPHMVVPQLPSQAEGPLQEGFARWAQPTLIVLTSHSVLESHLRQDR